MLVLKRCSYSRSLDSIFLLFPLSLSHPSFSDSSNSGLLPIFPVCTFLAYRRDGDVVYSLVAYTHPDYDGQPYQVLAHDDLPCDKRGRMKRNSLLCYLISFP